MKSGSLVLNSVSICEKKKITALLALYQFMTAVWLWFVVHPEAQLSAAVVLKGFLVNAHVDWELAIQAGEPCSHPRLPLLTKLNCLTEEDGSEAGACNACGAGFISLGKRRLGGEGGNLTAVFLYLGSGREDGARLLLGNIHPWRFLKGDKTRPDTTWKLVLFGGGHWTRSPSEVPSSLKYSIIL